MMVEKRTQNWVRFSHFWGLLRILSQIEEGRSLKLERRGSMCRRNQLRGLGLVLFGLGYLIGAIVGNGMIYLLAATGMIVWGICILRSS